jgi:hypothetical protein
VAGAQVVRYKSTPPQQQVLGNLPSAIFNLLALEESMMEEQGVTTTTMGKLPRGVKAAAAIESLKASEFANLTMPLNMLKKTVKEITEMFIEYADEYYVNPKQIAYTQNNENEYFDMIGSKGIDLQKKVKNELPTDIIVMSKESKVRIEVETGPGYTMEGKRANTLELVKLMSEMAANGLVTPEALKGVIVNLLETYQFGSTAEFVEAMEQGAPQGMAGMPGAPDQQKQMMKETVKEGMAEFVIDMQKAQQQPTGQQPTAGGA